MYAIFITGIMWDLGRESCPQGDFHRDIATSWNVMHLSGKKKKKNKDLDNSFNSGTINFLIFI